MTTVTLGTEPPIGLDVCTYCGGVWTDQGETNFFREADLSTIGIPPNQVKKIIPPKTRYCPKDATQLTRITGENIPGYVTVFHCPSCGGNWFPAGELKHFKHAQRVKLAFFKTWHIPVASPTAILLPIILLLIITGSIFVTVTSIQQQLQTESQAKALVGKPVVRTISSTQVFISFTTNSPIATSLIYWQTKAPTYRQKVSVSTAPQTIHTVRLSNLLPGTSYQYQIALEGVQPTTTEIFAFSTIKD